MSFRQRVVESPVARAAVLPVRIGAVGRHLAREAAAGSRWLVSSREYTNYTYDLTERNLRHLGVWVAGVTGATAGEASGFIAEIMGDHQLMRQIADATLASPRRRIADTNVRFGRRVGWYAMVRVLQPRLVVETGTDKGLGSCVLASALIRNGTGRLITIDTNPNSGVLITGPASAVTERVLGDSVSVLASIGQDVDLFVHDSLHTYQHELAELEAIERSLAPKGCVMSDNAHVTDALLDWSTAQGRPFSFFREEPLAHWYRGAGIGVSMPRA